VRAFIAFVLIAAAFAVGLMAALASRNDAERRVVGAGITIELPPGWSGEVRPHALGVLVGANFALPAGDDDNGSAAMREMTAGDARIALLEYEPPADAASARAWSGQFPALEGPPVIRSDDFASTEGVPPAHAFARRVFTASGRYFDLWVDFATPATRDDLLNIVNSSIATLRIESPAGA